MCAYAHQGFYANICNISNTIFNIFLYDLVCVLVIITFTIMITIKLFKYRNNRPDLGQSDNSGKEFKISLMLVIVANLFLILQILEMISFQMMKYYFACDVMNPIFISVMTVHPIFVILLVINHSIYFIIYMIFFETFRRTFIGLFMEPIYLCLTSVNY